MDAIRQWLDEQGLPQYAEAFEANDIDVDVLHTLTDQDLQALGVSLGNRRRLLEAFKDTSSSASHSAIADVTRDEAFVTRNDFAADGSIVMQQTAQFFGVELFA